MQTQQKSNTLSTEDKDIRHRLLEAMRRFGYKQVEVSKETSELIRCPSLHALVVAPRKD